MILLLLINVSVFHHQEVAFGISEFPLNGLVLKYRKILQASFIFFFKTMSEVVFIIHQSYTTLEPIWNHLHTSCWVPSIFISSRHSAIIIKIFNWNDSYFFQKEAAILRQNYLFQLQKSLFKMENLEIHLISFHLGIRAHLKVWTYHYWIFCALCSDPNFKSNSLNRLCGSIQYHPQNMNRWSRHQVLHNLRFKNLLLVNQ